MIRATRAAVLIGVVALVTACTNSSAGQPIPTGQSNKESTEPSPRSSTLNPEPAPVRPQEIQLNGKDPCALVLEADWPKFHIEKPGKPRSQDPNFKSPDCFYSNNFLALSVTLVVTEGISKWTDGARSGVVEQVESIEQFPAISITREADEYQCSVAVDVADGQYLLATVNPIPSKVQELPERCEYAHQWAESAMRTLVRS